MSDTTDEKLDKTIGELTSERDRLTKEFEDLSERNGGTENLSNWPEGHQVRGENLIRALDRLDDGILVKKAERAGKVEAVRSAAGLPSNREPGSAGDSGSLRSSGDAVHDRAARTIDDAHRSGLLPDHAAEKATGLIEGGLPAERSLAQRWVQTTGDPAYLRAFAKLCADAERGHLLWDGQEQAAYREVAALQGEMSRASMSLTSANGGYMVPLSLDPSIILTSSGSINPLRKIARVVQTTSNSWTGISSAGVTAEWKAEAAQAADASPTLGNPVVPVYLGDAYVTYSYEVGMDALHFAQELQKLLADAADQLQATAFTTGTGSGQPTGIITALTGTASEINAATDDIFAKADVYTLQNALPPRFSPNAQWCANLSIINLMSQMETTNGARLFPELSDGRLLNRRINELSNMDGTVTTSGAVSNFVLVYGDWSNFVIADRIGAQLELIPNLVGANQRPTGQRGAMLWFRTGSDSVNDNAFRMLDAQSAA